MEIGAVSSGAWLHQVRYKEAMSAYPALVTTYCALWAYVPVHRKLERSIINKMRSAAGTIELMMGNVRSRRVGTFLLRTIAVCVAAVACDWVVPALSSVFGA